MCYFFFRTFGDNDLVRFLNTIRTMLREVETEVPIIMQDRERCEFYANRILCALRHMVLINVHLQQSGNNHPDELQEIQTLQENLKAIYTSLFELPVMHGYAYRPPTERPSGPGRPGYVITSEQLACLRSEFSSWSQIARDLGVSRQTIYNRRRELGFYLDFERFSEIEDNNLDAMVQEELNAFPRTGETNVMAGLRQRGVYIKRWRVRESIIRVDPINRANRWGSRILRRPYSVPHPNYLWHMDTNMKLRHWRFCIHGCVDGFTRAIVYLRVNNNNRATTVLGCFQQAASEWGYPSRVRADNGGENIAVGEFMVWFRGENRGSFLTGPSVRNTRIERLWRDVVECVVSVFSSIFLFLEDRLFLDTGDDRDMYALHYIFRPRIQRLLDRFTMRFNHHSISTEHNRTPRQLWASGCLLSYRSPNAGIRDVFDQEMPSDLDTYGNDPDAPPPDPDNDVSGVHVAPVNFVLNNTLTMDLQQNFDPLSDDGNYGISIYLQVRDFINRAVQNDSNPSQQ